MADFILLVLFWFVKLIVYLIEHKKWGWLLVVIIIITIIYSSI